METAVSGLWHGFGVALQLQNLVWYFAGVMIGNLVGVLPGMGNPGGAHVLQVLMMCKI